jgi:hypothetical protein
MLTALTIRTQATRRARVEMRRAVQKSSAMQRVGQLGRGPSLWATLMALALLHQEVEQAGMRMARVARGHHPGAWVPG